MFLTESSYGDKKAYELLKESRRGYESIEVFFRNLKKPDERYFYSLCISHYTPIEVLERWVEEKPESADAFLCYGARLLQLSWQTRGYGSAQAVTEAGNWDNFHELLKITESVLLRCAELNLEDPTPWCYLIMVATWSPASEEDEANINLKHNIFQEVIERDPGNWIAHVHMVIALSEKWGCSHDQMFDFTFSVVGKAPEASDLQALIVKADIEYWKWCSGFGDDEEGAEEFVQNEDVQANVLMAYESSLLHPYYKENHYTKFIRYNMSGWFWIVKDIENLRHELHILGDGMDDTYWRWVGVEGDLRRARKLSLLDLMRNT